jgi:mycobactin polyketide synthetase MbtD
VAPDTPFGDYWYANLRNTVRLDRAFESAIRCGAGSFIELSAHPALLFTIGQIFEADVAEGPAVLVGSAHRDEPALDAMSANIVTAAVADPGYTWGAYLDGGTGPTGLKDVGLHGFPNAPMRAIPLWAHPEPLPPVRGTSRGPDMVVEHWERTAAPAPVEGPPAHLAVIDLGGARAVEGPLARALRAAIESHPAADLGAPRDAEIVAVIAPAFDGAGAHRAAEILKGLAGNGLLEYANSVGPRCHTVCLVTVGAERVGRHDAPPSPGHAALAAMHRSVGFDHPEQTFTHLDLPSWQLTPGAGPAVVDALLSGAGETALRSAASGHALFERSFRDAPAAARWPLDRGVLDDVVITGGAGAIGLHYARYLAERGARRIVLLSRRSADPEVLKALAAEYVTELVPAPCDITDQAQLSITAAKYGAGGASLIVHAAGSARFGASEGLSGLTDAAITDAFAAKVGGLAHLAEVWPVRAGARMLLCSSVSGLWGGRGHAAYSAANRLLDAMAAELRAGGRHCVAVRWGLWQAAAGGESGRGIVNAAEMENVERSGLRQMTPREAIEASLREWDDDPLVFSADAARLRIFLGGGCEPTCEQHRIAEFAAHHRAGTEVSVVDAVRSQLAAVLGIERAGELNLSESLFDLGIDSMLALDLRKRLKRMIGRTVSLAALMGEITGAELVEKLKGSGERPDRAQEVDVSRD